MRPTGRRRLQIPAITAGLLAAGIISNVHAQIQTAGTLFVNVDATGSADGPVTSLPNTGTLGGSFVPSGGAGATPTVGTVGGTKAMQFDGGDFLQLQDATGAAILAPAELTGLNPTRSIEVWALNPALAGEETLVSWGHRGGNPDGSNVSFNYGSDFRWGAVGHWGNRDIGWNNTGGGPVANRWHHLVYTFDGSTTRLYVDGQNTNGEYVGEGVVDTWPDTQILIGAQTEPNGFDVTAGLRFTGSIGRVRIHDEVLTASQVANNYNFEKAAFIDPTGPTEPPAIQPAKITTAPIHRYSFSDAAGDASNAVIDDSVGTADGVVLGAGATYNGTRLVLPGGGSATAAYGDLPNLLVSSHSTNNGGSGKFAIELWYKVTGSQNWGRVFDFGSSGTAAGTEEVLGPGGGGEGRDYLMYSAQVGGNTASRRLELRNEDPAGGGIATIDNATTSFNRDVHSLLTWDEETGRLIMYEDGRQVSTMVVNDAMSDLNDVNVWLGRSNWTGDANAAIEYDEVRVYDYILTPEQALGNAQGGPQQIHDHEFAPYIVANPSNVTVPQGQNATFTASLHGSAPLTLQWFRNGVAIANATNRTYTLANTTLNDSGATFTVKASNTVNGTPSEITTTAATLTVEPPTDRLTAGPIHRWSFNEPAGDATGATVEDSVGTADGTVLGDGATFTGSRVTLPGGSSATAAYADLPNGLLSSHGVANGGSGKFSIELWMKVTATRNWARIFDFGSSGGGDPTEEVFGPGGGGEGRDYFMYSASNGTDANNRRLEVRNEDPRGGGITTIDNATSTLNQDMHIVVTWDEPTGRLTTYQNGVQVSTGVTDDKMSDINDVNVWLGRSNWTGDANLEGEYNEVRIYDAVLTQRQALGNLQAGYTVINNADVAPTFVVAPATQSVLEGGNLRLNAEVHGSTPMTFQWLRNGEPIQGAITQSLTVSNVTSADNNASFTLRVQNSASTVTSAPAVLTVTPYVIQEIHRYTFNETEGTVINDSVGTAHGEAIGGVTLGGGQATLNGIDGYINLPNGIISELGADATIELWFSHDQPTTWARIYDFGISAGGEDLPDTGVDFLFLTARTGDGFPRFIANFPGGGDLVLLDPQPPGWIPRLEQKHVVVTWSSSKNISQLYYDGVLVRTQTAPQPLSNLTGRDVNNWLGRSQFAADALWAGSYNELRLTSGAMSAQQVAASFAAGPTPAGPVGPSITATRSGNNLTLSWPAAAATEGYVLQSTPALAPNGIWTNVTGATQNGANMEVSIPMDQTMRFFRLIKP